MKFSIKNDRLYKDNVPVHQVQTSRKYRNKVYPNPDLVIHYTVGEHFGSMVRALSEDGAGHGSAHIVLARAVF